MAKNIGFYLTLLSHRHYGTYRQAIQGAKGGQQVSTGVIVAMGRLG